MDLRSTGLTRSYWPSDTSTPVLDITVGDLLRAAASDAPDAVALVDGRPQPAERRTWTYRQLLTESERVARALLKRFAPGERLLIVAPNSAEWVILQMGAALAGIVLATANPAYRERELDYVLRRSHAAGVVATEQYRGHHIRATIERLAAELPHVRHVLVLECLDELLDQSPTRAPLPDVRPEDAAQIQYTGGTTGFPKAVLLHHRGIANTPNLVLTQAGMQIGDTWINVMPLFHVGGCVTTGLGIVGRRGAHVVLPEFQPGLVLELIEALGGNMSLLVPTMLVRVLEHPDLKRRDVSSVHTIVSGAAPVPAELIRRTKSAFGCQFTNIFGQTEVCGVVTTTRVEDTPEDQAETIGRAVPHVEIKIADPSTDEIVPVGTEGEICARGHQMMIGYLDDAEATAATLREDGWLHTGDLGSMDERGYVRITGRLKDMIIRGGENISPREVEEVLYTHPAVAEAIVLGVADAEWGEEVAAVVRAVNPAAPPSPIELRDHCRAQIARFKAPVLWAFVEAYPTTAAGKIQKFALREEIAAGRLALERVQSAPREAPPGPADTVRRVDP
jgi:fatty-acyl-CoA synthase